MSSPRSRQFVVRPARFHLVFVALLLLSGITACNRQPDADSVSTTTASPIEPAPDEATPRITSVGVDGFPRFALGIEYMELGLAEAYAPMGIRWAKTRLEAFSWGISEPEPPLGDVHRYDWSLTDALIAEYQSAGFTTIQSYLGSKSSWGTVSASDVMPKPEYLDDYGAWVGALIERYDGDGAEDMPGA